MLTNGETQKRVIPELTEEEKWELFDYFEAQKKVVSQPVYEQIEMNCEEESEEVVIEE